MKRLLRYKRFWLVLLLPLAVGTLRLASTKPEWVERLYSRGIYIILAGILGRLVSLFPCSLSELALLSIPILLLLYIAHRVRKRRLLPRKIYVTKRRPDIIRYLANLCALIGCTYFLFAIVCGFNYHRLTFAQQSGLDVRPSSVEELASLCTKLVNEANEARELLPQNSEGLMILSGTPYQVAKKARALYPLAAEKYPELKGYVARPKPVLTSRLMSYLQISGIYNPFFFEPNVNVDIMDFQIPSSMMHEMSHFKGFMREDEANFLSYLTCKHSGDPEFVYSGTMLALMHSSNALYSADRDLYWQVMEPLSPKVRADWNANSLYWQQFDGPVAEVSTAVNNAYLKSNLQQSGVKSYGEMVDLLLAEHRIENQFSASA